MMTLLTISPFGVVTLGIASYLFYVRTVCYMIAAVICIVGSLSVYIDILEGERDVRMKITRLTFACLFFVSASTALPSFFGMDSESKELAYLDDSPFKEWGVVGYIWAEDLSKNLEPYVVDNAVIWVTKNEN